MKQKSPVYNYRAFKRARSRYNEPATKATQAEGVRRPAPARGDWRSPTRVAY